jgi:hypothetical protein
MMMPQSEKFLTSPKDFQTTLELSNEALVHAARNRAPFQ